MWIEYLSDWEINRVLVRQPGHHVLPLVPGQYTIEERRIHHHAQRPAGHNRRVHQVWSQEIPPGRAPVTSRGDGGRVSPAARR